MILRRLAVALLLAAWLASVGWPAIASLGTLAFGAASVPASQRLIPPVTGGPDVFLGTWPLLLNSLLWAGSIALVATLGGAFVGAGLVRRWSRGGGRTLALVALVPLALPGYLVFWSLWQATGPGTWIGDLAIRADAVAGLRHACVFFGLAAWSMPLAAWTVGLWRSARSDRCDELVRVDRLGWWRAARVAWPLERPALVRAWAIATVAVLGESVSFDLAQIRTYGYELRTMDATGSPARDVLIAGWPAVVAALALLLTAWWVGLSRRRAPGRPAPEPPPQGPGRWLPWIIAAGACGPVLGLVGLAWQVRDAGGFVALYGAAAASSVALAAAAGGALAALAACLALVWSTRSVWTRRATACLALGWFVTATAPATLIAVAIEAAWNRPWVGPIVYDSPLIVLLGILARLGAVAVLAASLARMVVPRSHRDLAALDRPRSMRAVWLANRPSLATAALVAGSVGGALAFGEIATVSRLVPPGIELLATSTLNAIHYQQPETVVLASLIAIGLAVAAATVVALLSRPPRGRSWLGGLVAATLAVGGCGAHTGSGDGVPAVPVVRAVGTPGFGHGQFHTPRAVAYDPRNERWFVVDKEARVQRFAEDGSYELEWRMPDSANGKPVGLAIHPDGRVFIADTHYYRVLVYDQEGQELARFGSYGRGPGEFIYVTDVAFAPDGRIFVGECGGNDRIQVFSPDLAYLGSFGSFGLEQGELSRPQSLVFDGGELLVADSNNHRIQVYDDAGRLLRSAGHAGRGPGEFSYPRGLVPLGDGTVLVCEFGNHRIQRIDLRVGSEFGHSLGIWGGPPSERNGEPGEVTGDDRGRLKYPWDVAGVDGRVAVLDSGRDRLVLATLP